MAGGMIEVALCECLNPLCHSKQTFDGLGEAFSRPAERVLGKLSQRTAAGHVHFFYRCVWCDFEAKPVEEVAA